MNFGELVFSFFPLELAFEGYIINELFFGNGRKSYEAHVST